MIINDITSKVWNGADKSSTVGFAKYVGKGLCTDFYVRNDGSLEISRLNGTTVVIPVGQYLVRINTTYFVSKVRHTKFK